MKDIDTTKLSADDWDELNFPRPEVQDFDRVVERAISRRGFLGGVLAFGSGAAVMGTSFLKGSTAMALLVRREENGEKKEYVLKVALTPAQNDRLADETTGSPVPYDLVIETEHAWVSMELEAKPRVRMTPELVKKLTSLLGPGHVRLVGGVSIDKTKPDGRERHRNRA